MDWQREKNSGHLLFEGFLQFFIYCRHPQFSELKNVEYFMRVISLREHFISLSYIYFFSFYKCDQLSDKMLSANNIHFRLIFTLISVFHHIEA